MMPNFMPIGKTWLNVDSIRIVDVDETNNGTLICTVQFSGGGTKEYHGEDAKQLIDVLKKNRAKE